MGRDGQEYVLRCSMDGPTLKQLGSSTALTYDIPFLFYNGQLFHVLESFIFVKYKLLISSFCTLIHYK